MTSAPDFKHRVDLKSFGRRHGKKLRPARKRLLAELLPKIAVDPKSSIRSQFPSSLSTLWLEIGFGGGEHMAAQAANNPHVALVGCEPFVDGVAKLLALVDQANVPNIRIHDDDARQIFPCFKEGDVDRIFVLFPDPWRKTKHHKRRLVQTRLLDDFATMLKDGGEFRFASDHMDYVRWTLAHVMRHPDFEWIAETPNDWREPPKDWISTRYEKKALNNAKPCVYLRFRRKSRN